MRTWWKRCAARDTDSALRNELEHLLPAVSFRRRLQWSFIAVSVVVPTAAVVGLVLTARRAEERDLGDTLILEIRETLRELRAQPEGTGPRLSEESIEPEYGTELTRYVSLFDPQGKILAQNSAMRACESLRLPQPLPHRGFDIPCGTTKLRAIVREVNRPGFGALVLAVPRTSLDADTRFMAKLAAGFMVVSALVATLISVLLTRRLASGLERIAETTRRVAAGDLAARAPEQDGDDEVRELALNVNHMVGQIQTLVGAQEGFIAHAAHELRSPLTTLYGELALALRRPRTAEEYKRALGEAHASAMHLKQLAEALLELARAGRETQSDRDKRSVAEAINSAVVAREGLAQQRRVQVLCEGPSTDALAPATDVERVVGNLVENALKHAPPNTCVRVHWSAAQGQVLLHVDDAGPGVAAEDRDRLFEPFFRGAKHRADDASGFGLGLAIVRELVRKNRGTVSVGSSPEGGARFSVTLPVAREGE